MTDTTTFTPSSELIDQIRLSDDFLSEYRGRQPKWGFDGLGYIIYLRTYARTKPDGTLEEWSETVQRFTEGNFRTEAERLDAIGRLDAAAVDALNREMQLFYYLAFNLVLLPPGRGMWISGTDYEKRSGDALNNCWLVSMRPQPFEPGQPAKVSFAPCFTFDQAMKGGGVGANVQRKYVSQIPRVGNRLNLRFTCSERHPNYESELKPMGVTQPSLLKRSERLMTHVVEDSREGWVTALRIVIDAHYDGWDDLTLDLSQIRPRGAKIVGFGGTASGPAPLVRMLQRINDILNGRVNDCVTPVEWGDIIQIIGTCVVSGNVRRTALILIGDQDDQAFVQSKNYALPENTVASQWRWASNNSVDINADTDRTTLRGVAENVYYNGEPTDTWALV